MEKSCRCSWGTALHTAVSGSIPGRVGIFNKLGGMLELQAQSLLSVPNIPGLNPNSLHTSYDVKANVLLIVIRPPYRNVKPSGLLGAIRKNKLMPAPGFPFTLPHIIFITPTIQHTYTHPTHLLNLRHHSVLWLAEVVHKLKIDHNSVSIRGVAGPKCYSCIYGSALESQNQIT